MTGCVGDQKVLTPLLVDASAFRLPRIQFLLLFCNDKLEKKLEPGHLMDFLDKQETIWEKF